MNRRSSENSYFDVERSEAIAYVPNGSVRVLDIGCGGGATMRLLRQRNPSVEVVGVEINQSVASRSEENIVVGSVDHQDVRRQLLEMGPFHCVMALDVLEHLVDPWETLSFLATVLRPGGRVIISIPNVANVKAWLPLVFVDQFRYVDAGILDKTHLRFFTRVSARELVIASGLHLLAISPTGPVRWSMVKSRGGLLAFILNMMTCRCFERFVAHQYLLIASRPE
jgi:2-polyprenyl-3-methyl-5-hydroxy-6-metoxy-1,4-benzoquinol methylase